MPKKREYLLYRGTFNDWSGRRYEKMKKKSIIRNMDLPSFTKEEFRSWAVENGIEKLLYNWKQSGFDKWLSPSVNRLDDYKTYTFDNMELITWKENSKKWYGSEKNIETCLKKMWLSDNIRGAKKVYKISLDGDVLATYPSIWEASRQNNANQSSISKVCRGLKKHHRGFKWAFV